MKGFKNMEADAQINLRGLFHTEKGFIVRIYPIFNFLSSMKTGIFLMLIICISSFLGTVIVQNHPQGYYEGRFGRIGYKLISLLSINDIYHSFWFIFLLFLFSQNLLLCTALRIKRKVIPIPSILLHLSLILIAAGGLVGLMFGEEGLVKLKKGERANIFYDRYNKPRSLDFNIILQDFKRETYKNFKSRLKITLLEKNITWDFVLNGKREFKLEGTPYKILILKETPDFSKDASIPIEVREIKALKGPALKLAIIEPFGKRDIRWLFSNNPYLDINIKADENILTYYKREPDIRDLISSIRIFSKEDSTEGLVKVNAPLKFMGYSFYQYDYDPIAYQWTILKIVKDPSVPFIYAGFLLFTLGLGFHLYPRFYSKGRKDVYRAS